MAETIIRVHCDHIFVHRFVAPEAKVGQPKRSESLDRKNVAKGGKP
jgi:hypothetical protein